MGKTRKSPAHQNSKEAHDHVQLRGEIREEVLTQIDLSKEVNDEIIFDMIDQAVLFKGRQTYISLEEKQQLRREIFNGIRRLDVLQELLEEDSVTEIMINGPSDIFIEQEGKIHKWEKCFENREKLEDVIQQIVSKANRMVNESTPIVDVRLQDGSRVNVVLPPVAINGPIVTIRRFPKNPITMEGLVEIGSLSREAADFLQKLVKARYNIFISGGTGAGKTTFLNALSGYIPSEERVITIEDSAELQIQGIPNLVRMEVRNANTEGKNTIDIRQLIRSALRMRPDRIIVGEVRDAAAIDMIQAMNTGHDGSLSTGHANGPAEMLSRLETLVLMGMDIPLSAVRSQIASAVDIIVQLGRLRDKSRKTLSISQVVGIEHGEIICQPLYVFREEEGGHGQRVVGDLVPTKHTLYRRKKLEAAGICL